MPSKKEIQLLRYLNRVETRYDNNKRGDLEKNLKEKLNITDADIGDMHYSEYLQFSSIILPPSETHSNEHRVEPIICITHAGSTFIQGYGYGRVKELFYWVFGVAAVIAGIFAVLTFITPSPSYVAPAGKSGEQSPASTASTTSGNQTKDISAQVTQTANATPIKLIGNITATEMVNGRRITEVKVSTGSNAAFTGTVLVDLNNAQTKLSVPYGPGRPYLIWVRPTATNDIYTATEIEAWNAGYPY